jgi:hypothetical protein
MFSLFLCGISLFLSFYPIHGKYLRSDEVFWNDIQNSLQKKEGKLPLNVRTFPERRPGESSDLQKEIDDQMNNFHGNDLRGNDGQDETHSNFANLHQNVRKNVIKKSYNNGVGQVMRGESAKEIYKAQIKYDTVDGFHQELNQQNSTGPKKKKEIVILKSMPKSTIPFLASSTKSNHCLENLPKTSSQSTPQSSTFRKYVSKEEKSRKFVERKDFRNGNEPYWNIGGGDGEDDVTIG